MEPPLVVTITSTGLVEAITGLNRLDASLRDMTDLASQLSNIQAEQLAKLSQATPIQSSAMANSWYVEQSVASYEFNGRIYNSSPYAAFVAEGTGVYGPPSKGSGREIVSKSGKPFVFWKEGRKFRLMKHKGQPANENLADALGEVPQGTIRAADRVLRGLLEYTFKSQTTPGIIVHGGG